MGKKRYHNSTLTIAAAVGTSDIQSNGLFYARLGENFEDKGVHKKPETVLDTTRRNPSLWEIPVTRGPLVTVIRPPHPLPRSLSRINVESSTTSRSNSSTP
jgi:hypothetical protein